MDLDAGLIERIYGGGLAEEPWQDLVRELCERLDAVIFVLAFRTIREDLPSVGVQAFRGRGKEVWDAFFADYKDVPTFDYDRIKPGQVYPLRDFEPHPASDISRARRDMLGPLGGGESYCLALHSRGAPVGYMVWVKPAGRPITEDELAWSLLVARPLARAVAGYHRMRIAELSSRLAAEALGQLEVGVIAIDNDSRILFSNDVARRLVDECPDIGWREGRLVMARADLAAKLEVSRTAVQAAQVRGLDEAMIGLLMVSVEDGRDELGPGSRPERAIYLHEVARSKPIPEQLIAELFGLSRPEARLSALLCQGLTLQEAAAHMGVTENSARTYSKLAFSNLGVSRQTELVRRIVTSVAMFGNIRSS